LAPAQSGRFGIAGAIGHGGGEDVTKSALLVATALHRGRNAHGFAVLRDRAAGDINARTAQAFHDGVVGQDRGWSLRIDQQLDVVTHGFGRSTAPEGVKVEFVQAPPAAVAINALFPHIIHVGAIIKDRALQDGFYRDVLGFKPYWFGGMKDDAPPSWVSQQVPDGTDWLEYMITTNPALTQAQMGVLNHFALGVPNMQAAYTKLWNDDRLQGQVDARSQQTVPKIGRDAKWQLNLIDPDGTRAEVMELRAIGKPCCSPFTAADPEK